jgi:hypothetical protein
LTGCRASSTLSGAWPGPDLVSPRDPQFGPGHAWELPARPTPFGLTRASRWVTARSAQCTARRRQAVAQASRIRCWVATVSRDMDVSCSR